MPEYLKGVCSECGAPIYTSEREKHTAFHEKIDEVVQWVQATDKVLFHNGGQSETPSIEL